jgi:sugar/nucleoside kinase (ribokinase family)
MSLLVVGSVALDTVETPADTRENVLGGSAVYAAYAASFFCPVQLVGVVGEDWPEEHTRMLAERNIGTEGLEVEAGGKTFRWTGKYHENMNTRDTLDVQLNVLEGFDPKLPEAYRRAQFVLLANGATETQLKVLEQCPGADLVVADTMDLWITTDRERLETLMQKIDGLVLNDSEAELLTDEGNMLTAAKKILDMGPRFVVIKRGEFGCMFLGQHVMYLMPAFPTEKLIDPTGAGDCFIGAMMGYLAAHGSADDAAIKRALAYGTLVAGYDVEGFSLERLQQITREEIDRRFQEFQGMVCF